MNRRAVVALLVIAPCAIAPAALAQGACTKPLYLTLDTGHMGVAPLVAEVLARQQVKVTFFAANEPTKEGDGSLGQHWAAWWKARAGEGHEFASHTYNHTYWRADVGGGERASTSSARTGEQVSRSTGEQVSRSTGEQVSRSTGEQVSRSTGEQVSRSTGEQVSRSTGEPVSRSTGEQVSRSTGEPERFRVRASAGPDAGRDFTWTAAQYCAEVKHAADRLEAITGRKPLPLFRAPGGKTSPRLTEAVRACGYAHVGWSPAGFLGDELPSDKAPNDMLLRKALRDVRAGDILVAHLGIWSRKDPWAPAVLEPLLVGLKEKGFCFRTLRDHPQYRDWIAGKR